MKINLKPTKMNIKFNLQKVFPELEDLEVTPSIEQQTFNHPNSYGYDEVIVNAIDINLQDKTVNPTTSEQTIEADNGYDALSSVVVNPVTNAIDENIQANNIKNGVSILGVQGNIVELLGEEKTIAPITSEQVILPSSGKNAITKVTVNAVNSSIDNNIQANNIKNGVEILGTTGTVVELVGEAREITQNGNYTPSSGKNAITSLSVNVAPDTSDATAVAGDISSGKTAYTASGKVTGTLQLLGAQNIRGSYDRAGLLEIGYTNADVDVYDGICNHYKSRNSEYILTQEDKDLYGIITENNISSYKGVLKYMPQISITKTTISSMFSNCNLLQTIPLLDTSNVTTFTAMFNGCNLLQTIPQLDTSNVTTISSMFYNCNSLQTIPQLDTSNVTTFSYMFYNCNSLHTIPLLDMSKAISISNMFNGCSSLQNLGGLLNLGQAYLTTVSANYSNYALRLDYSNSLTHDSLMNVINNLYDIATKGCNTQKLQLGTTNLAKLTAQEIAIATAKGFTVS